jgi:hypothetical protein
MRIGRLGDDRPVAENGRGRRNPIAALPARLDTAPRGGGERWIGQRICRIEHRLAVARTA